MNANRMILETATLFGVAVICGCRHPMADYEAKLTGGDYSGAASIATEEIKDGDNDELMWRLMAGSANRLAGESESAIAQFDRAEDVMIDHDGTSVFAKGMTTTPKRAVVSRIILFALIQFSVYQPMLMNGRAMPD